MKISRTIILLMLIVAVLVVGCEGQLNPLGDPLGDKDARGDELSQENIDTIAFLGLVAMTHTTLHFQIAMEDPEGFDPIDPVIWEESLTIETVNFGNLITMTSDIVWEDFDVGKSIKYFLDFNLVDDTDYRLYDFIDEGELIVLSNSSAQTVGNPANVTLDIQLHINSIDYEDVPDGTYHVILSLEKFNPEDIDELVFISATVDGDEAHLGDPDDEEDPD